MAKKKQRRQTQRLQSARTWLPTYEGKNIAKGYRKRYRVDWPTAFRELEMLGVEFDPAYKEQVLSTIERQRELRRQKKQERTLEPFEGIDQDDHFAYIVGYTSGGAPYGLTWEEWTTLEDEADEDMGEPGARLMTQREFSQLYEYLQSPEGCHFVDAPDTPEGIEWDCDNTLRFTRKWLEQHNLDVETNVRALEACSGCCDCEVVFNVADRWADYLQEHQSVDD
ncbi:MAG: DUF2695 domain-containing protein [Anaerolineae bacterium]|nr:DUF2695 domain-containing protein [Anaerolineae bacterium]